MVLRFHWAARARCLQIEHFRRMRMDFRYLKKHIQPIINQHF